MSDRNKLINKALERFLPSSRTHPKPIHEAMRYSVFAGGKRLRPILVLAVAEAYEIDIGKVIPFACAVEMVQTASLIFDDLPNSDDAKYRRGKKSLHQKYNELIAINAALGLCAKVGEVSIGSETDNIIRLKDAVKLLTNSVGTEGLIGGQFVDIVTVGKKPDKKYIKYIYYHKTAKLFIAAIEGSAILCNANDKERVAFSEFAKNLGIAFQIRDDLLDTTANEIDVGKDVQKDKNKMTVIRLLGIEKSKKLKDKYFDKALNNLDKIQKDTSTFTSIVELLRK